jgi:hypothetical protein
MMLGSCVHLTQPRTTTRSNDEATHTESLASPTARFYQTSDVYLLSCCQCRPLAAENKEQADRGLSLSAVSHSLHTCWHLGV